MQIFYSALNDTGRAGFVMANSAADAGGSELEIRRKLIEDRAVDIVVSVGPNFFYTVTLPCTLWFLDRGKRDRPVVAGVTDPGHSTVLFLDARHIYRQIDRAHRDWTPAQIGFLANVVRLYRGEAPDFTLGGDEARAKLEEVFGSAAVPGSTRVPRVGEGVPPSRTSGRVAGHARVESSPHASGSSFRRDAETNTRDACEIGRASCRERV